MRKTILLLVPIITVTLFAFAYITHALAQQYPQHQHPHPHQPPAQQPGQQAAQQPAGPSLDQLKAKNFTVRTLNGQSVSLNTLLGEGKPVLIDFWATWCGPCRMVIPHLSEIHRKYGKDGLIVIGLNLDDSTTQGQVSNFVKRNRMDYQNVFAPHAIYQLFSGLAVARIPYTLLFGPDGKLVWRLVGYSPQISNALNSAIEKALAAAPATPAEPTAPEKQAEPIAPEKQAEQSAPAKPMASETTVKPAENAPAEKPVEQTAPEKPAEQSASEKPVENGPVAKPAEQSALEKSVEQSAPEKPAEQAPPATGGCNCNCCSHSEKKTEQSAPERPAEQ
ncbi:MAG TPA: redoxin domain-containing protein [Blastocatellia bacterium]|nr:redoxin domain-containing protein [Blastocatellia bacterium]